MEFREKEEATQLRTEENEQTQHVEEEQARPEAEGQAKRVPHLLVVLIHQRGSDKI